MPDDYTIGDLARQDIYPDERGFQPPVDPLNLPPEAYASLGGGDLGLLGSKGVAGLFGKPSWLQRAQDAAQKDVAAYQGGGIGELLANTQAAQDLSGGFGGNIKGVKASVVPGALAALGDYHPPFYSAVERAVQDAKQNVAPGQQWAGFLRNQPGVKPEEVETLGLGKLFEQPTVSKDAVLGEIAANKVNVGEVVKGAPDPSAAQLEKVAQERYGTSLSDPYLTEGQRMAVRDEAMSQSGAAPTKFSSYTLPGGENYREMLLTLPITNVEKAKFERMTALEQKLRNPADYDAPELNALRAEYKQLADETRNVGAFQSSHYDEPNILAHVRYNDRVIDGKKTLFVEEVQSDWHQKGKREGYQQEPDTSGWKATPSSTEPQPQDNRAPGGWWNVYDQSGNRVGTTPRHAATTPDAAIADVAGREKFKGVPDAPFKTTWPDLAMKRIIREAAEKGYDKVAWTPGGMQADRYDLSKQVDKISSYRLQNAGELELKDGQPQYRIEAFKDGKLAVDKYVLENELADTVGKELAEKMIKQENGARSYSGLDLKVGGEGMKGFYDQILPATVNKLVKKHGARVEQQYIDKPYVDQFGKTKQEQTQPVHTIDITPSLRAAAMKGFPLFTAGGIAATGMMGDLAKQDDYQ